MSAGYFLSLKRQIDEEFHLLSLGLSSFTDDELSETLYKRFSQQIDYLQDLFDAISEEAKHLNLDQANPELYQLLEAKQAISDCYGQFNREKNIFYKRFAKFRNNREDDLVRSRMEPELDTDEAEELPEEVQDDIPEVLDLDEEPDPEAAAAAKAAERKARQEKLAADAKKRDAQYQAGQHLQKEAAKLGILVHPDQPISEADIQNERIRQEEQRQQEAARETARIQEENEALRRTQERMEQAEHFDRVQSSHIDMSREGIGHHNVESSDSLSDERIPAGNQIPGFQQNIKQEAPAPGGSNAQGPDISETPQFGAPASTTHEKPSESRQEHSSVSPVFPFPQESQNSAIDENQPKRHNYIHSAQQSEGLQDPAPVAEDKFATPHVGFSKGPSDVHRTEEMRSFAVQESPDGKSFEPQRIVPASELPKQNVQEPVSRISDTPLHSADSPNSFAAAAVDPGFIPRREDHVTESKPNVSESNFAYTPLHSQDIDPVGAVPQPVTSKSEIYKDPVVQAAETAQEASRPAQPERPQDYCRDIPEKAPHTEAPLLKPKDEQGSAPVKETPARVPGEQSHVNAVPVAPAGTHVPPIPSGSPIATTAPVDPGFVPHREDRIPQTQPIQDVEPVVSAPQPITPEAAIHKDPVNNSAETLQEPFSSVQPERPRDYRRDIPEKAPHTEAPLLKAKEEQGSTPVKEIVRHPPDDISTKNIRQDAPPLSTKEARINPAAGSSVDVKGEVQHQHGADQPVGFVPYRFTPNGVAPVVSVVSAGETAALQTADSNEKIYSALLASGVEGSNVAVKVSPALENQMVFNVELARIAYEDVRGTAGASAAVHQYIAQRNALSEFRAAVRKGTVVVEEPQPAVVEHAANGKVSTVNEKASNGAAAVFAFTPGGTMAKTIENGKASANTFVFHNQGLPGKPAYSAAHPMVVTNQYEEAITNKMRMATASLDAAIASGEPKAHSVNPLEVKMYTDAYLAFQQAKREGSVVISDRGDGQDIPDYSSWQQKRTAQKTMAAAGGAPPGNPPKGPSGGPPDNPNLHVGTTGQTFGPNPNKAKKKTVKETSASIFSRDSLLKRQSLASVYAKQLGSRFQYWATGAVFSLSREMYNIAQRGEDNALHTMETARYYITTSAGVVLAVATTAPVKNLGKRIDSATNREFNLFGTKSLQTNRELSAAVNDGLRRVRELDAQITSLEGQITILKGKMQPSGLDKLSQRQLEMLVDQLKQLKDERAGVAKSLSVNQKMKTLRNEAKLEAELHKKLDKDGMLPENAKKLQESAKKNQ